MLKKSVTRDVKKRAFPMAEEKWSLAVAGGELSLDPQKSQAEISNHQMIVTRERIS
jgi:hypothetical protein